MLKKESILGFHFVNTTMHQLVEEIEDQVRTTSKAFVVTANPEIIMYAHSDETYKEIVNEASYITPDGIGVIIGSKILKKPIRERLPGFDLMGRLLALSNEKGYRVFLLGATEEVITTAKGNIEKAFPHITVSGYHNGFFDWNDQKLVNQIIDSNSDFVFVGLGFPRQEKWIYQNMPYFNKGVFIGVGGSFDVWAGKVKRAPEIWQKLNLEWFYRLIKQPSRWRRMLVLPLFLVKVIKIRLFRLNEGIKERG